MEPEVSTTEGEKRKSKVIIVAIALIIIAVVSWYMLVIKNSAVLSVETTGQVVPSQAERNRLIAQIVESIPHATSSPTVTQQVLKSIPKQIHPLTTDEKTAIVQSIPPPVLQ